MTNLAEFLTAQTRELYARKLFESVAGSLTSRAEEEREHRAALAAQGGIPGQAPAIFHRLFAEDSADRAQIIAHKFSVSALAALSEMAATCERDQLPDGPQRNPLNAELDLLQLVRVAHTRRLLGIESAEGECILEQLHKVVLEYGMSVAREYSLYDAGDTMRRNSNVATPPLVPWVTQPYAAERLRHFIGQLYDAFQRCGRKSDRAAIAQMYIAKMADAACQLGFGSGPIATSYSGKLFEKSCTRLRESEDTRTRDKCVSALFRYALRLRGLSKDEATNLDREKRRHSSRK